jgi:hypothetical protein
MLAALSIKSLYALALAEGEGVGTAYEYYVKRRLLAGWLSRVPKPQRILVAGLPEKYGASMDFLQLATDLRASVTVVDDRPTALERLRSGIDSLADTAWFKDLAWDSLEVASISKLAELDTRFDLGLSSEVLQRLAPDVRLRYIARLRELASHIALFAPNAENPAHTELSGLSGLNGAAINALVGHRPAHTGYIDMPPFPPGIVRSAAQRDQASKGRVEAFAMQGLACYARLERLFPVSVRKRRAHIVFALISKADG